MEEKEKHDYFRPDMPTGEIENTKNKNITKIQSNGD